MTTHVGLTARALGADRVIFETSANDAVRTARDVTDRFGGPFAVETTESPKARLRNFEGSVVHLTMYGERVQNVEDAIREAHDTDPLLIVVGAEKMPFEVYEHADWNVAVTNQPHSEIAGLAVLLDHLFEGRGLDQEWTDADRSVVPQATGKQVESVDEDQS